MKTTGTEERKKKKCSRAGRVAAGIAACAATAALIALFSIYAHRQIDRSRDLGIYTGVWHGTVFGQEADWYLTDGRVEAFADGLMPDGQDGYCLTHHGRADLKFTGTYAEETKDGDVLWYVEDGRTGNGISGIMGAETLSDGGVWYLVQDGVVDEGFTGLSDGTVDGEAGTWYVYHGRVSTGHTGFIEDGGEWKYVFLGEYDDALTVIRYGTVDGKTALWYVEDGAARTDLTGFVSLGGEWLYVRGGEFDAGKTTILCGAVDGKEGAWYVKDGKAQTDFTGFVTWSGPTVYIKDGIADFSFTGIAHGKISDQEADWYVRNGIADASYSGTVTVNGQDYSVDDGKAEKIVAHASSGPAAKKMSSDSSGSSKSSSPYRPANVVMAGFTGGQSAGTYLGRLRIPSAGINVGLYHCSLTDYDYNQAITDRKDSACYLWGQNYYSSAIADHSNQAFSALKNVKTGAYMYIDTGSAAYRYKCVATGTGKASGNFIYSDSGACLDTAYSSSAVYCYTCTSWPGIRYAVFQPG